MATQVASAEDVAYRINGRTHAVGNWPGRQQSSYKLDEDPSENPNGFGSTARAALLGSAPLAPLLAGAIAIATYVHPLWPAFPVNLPSLVAGAVDLGVAWVLLATTLELLGFTDVKHANSTAYCELRNMLTEVDGMALAVMPEPSPTGNGPGPIELGRNARACLQFHGYRNEAKRALDGEVWSRSKWVLGTGYVSAWRLLHRAQQILVAVEPVSAVLERANFDLQRLAGSSMENRALLGERLSQAINVLRPYAVDGTEVAAVRQLADNLRGTALRLETWTPSDNSRDALELASHLGQTARELFRAPVAAADQSGLYAELLRAQQEVASPRLSYHIPPLARERTIACLEDAIRRLKHPKQSATLQSVAMLVAEFERLRAKLINWSNPSAVDVRDALMQEVDCFEGQIRDTLQMNGSGRDLLAALAGVREVVQGPILMHWTDNQSQLVAHLHEFIPRLNPAPSLPEPDPCAPPPSSNFGVPPPPRSMTDARLVVGAVRETLDEHRDKSREGLVRARNRLDCTTVSTAIIAYLVLWLAIGSAIVHVQLLSAVAYFLVGALTGLFARQYAEFGSETATDDFGLSSMRLLAAPQLSGVAAVFGVALLALADRAMQPTSLVGGLGSAFDVQSVPVNIVVAAVFGLTPGLLIDRLKQQTDGLRNNLRKTEPQEAPAPTM